MCFSDCQTSCLFSLARFCTNSSHFTKTSVAACAGQPGVLGEPEAPHSSLYAPHSSFPGLVNKWKCCVCNGCFNFSVVFQLDCAWSWFLLALFGGLVLLTRGSAMPTEGPVLTLRTVVNWASNSHTLPPSTFFVSVQPWPQVPVGITVWNGPAGPGPPVGSLLLSFPGSPVTTLLTRPQEQARHGSGLARALNLE